MSVKINKKPPVKAANENQPSAVSQAAMTAEAKKAFQSFEAVSQMRPLSELKPSPHNARTHSPRQVQQIAASIREFGFLAPVLIDEDNMILAGHGRAEAAKLLDMTLVPTVPIHHLSRERKRAFMLADNRLAALSDWNQEVLAVELKDLSTLELDFHFEVTGFDTVDVDYLVAPAAEKKKPPEVVAEPDRTAPPVSLLGDLWQLGRHRLLCGDALEPACYERLMRQERAQMVFSDPPFNVKIDGHVSGLGKVKHADFKMASGEMSEPEFTTFLQTAMRRMAEVSVDGAIHFLCMDWRHMGEMLIAAKPVYGELKNLVVWNKSNAGMGTFYRSKHELVFVFKVGSAKHVNNFGLGERGRYRTNVWDYAGVNTFRPGRMAELASHPTVKPLTMVVDALKDCSDRKGIVLDPFAGSGTTLLAAEKTGRVGRAIELDPHYVDIAIGRWQALTGERAVHVATGVTFDDVTEHRARAAA